MAIHSRRPSLSRDENRRLGALFQVLEPEYCVRFSMYASRQTDFQFWGIASGERNNLLEVQEVQVGLVVLEVQVLPREIFFFFLI